MLNFKDETFKPVIAALQMWTSVGQVVFNLKEVQRGLENVIQQSGEPPPAKQGPWDTGTHEQDGRFATPQPAQESDPGQSAHAVRTHLRRAHEALLNVEKEAATAEPRVLPNIHDCVVKEAAAAAAALSVVAKLVAASREQNLSADAAEALDVLTHLAQLLTQHQQQHALIAADAARQAMSLGDERAAAAAALRSKDAAAVATSAACLGGLKLVVELNSGLDAARQAADGAVALVAQAAGIWKRSGSAASADGAASGPHGSEPTPLEVMLSAGDVMAAPARPTPLGETPAAGSEDAAEARPGSLDLRFDAGTLARTSPERSYSCDAAVQIEAAAAAAGAEATPASATAMEAPRRSSDGAAATVAPKLLLESAPGSDPQSALGRAPGPAPESAPEPSGSLAVDGGSGTGAETSAGEHTAAVLANAVADALPPLDAAVGVNAAEAEEAVPAAAETNAMDGAVLSYRLADATAATVAAGKAELPSSVARVAVGSGTVKASGPSGEASVLPALAVAVAEEAEGGLAAGVVPTLPPPCPAVSQLEIADVVIPDLADAPPPPPPPGPLSASCIPQPARQPRSVQSPHASSTQQSSSSSATAAAAGAAEATASSSTTQSNDGGDCVSDLDDLRREMHLLAVAMEQAQADDEQPAPDVALEDAMIHLINLAGGTVNILSSAAGTSGAAAETACAAVACVFGPQTWCSVLKMLVTTLNLIGDAEAMSTKRRIRLQRCAEALRAIYSYFAVLYATIQRHDQSAAIGMDQQIRALARTGAVRRLVAAVAELAVAAGTYIRIDASSAVAVPEQPAGTPAALVAGAMATEESQVAEVSTPDTSMSLRAVGSAAAEPAGTAAAGTTMEAVAVPVVGGVGGGAWFGSDGRLQTGWEQWTEVAVPLCLLLTEVIVNAQRYWLDARVGEAQRELQGEILKSRALEHLSRAVVLHRHAVTRRSPFRSGNGTAGTAAPPPRLTLPPLPRPPYFGAGKVDKADAASCTHLHVLCNLLVSLMTTTVTASRPWAVWADVLLSGPCVQTFLLLHVVSQLYAADGGIDYGLRRVCDAPMLPPAFGHPVSKDSAASSTASADQAAGVRHELWTDLMVKAFRMWSRGRVRPCSAGALRAVCTRAAATAQTWWLPYVPGTGGGDVGASSSKGSAVAENAGACFAAFDALKLALAALTCAVVLGLGRPADTVRALWEPVVQTASAAVQLSKRFCWDNPLSLLCSMPLPPWLPEHLAGTEGATDPWVPYPGPDLGPVLQSGYVACLERSLRAELQKAAGFAAVGATGNSASSSSIATELVTYAGVFRSLKSLLVQDWSAVLAFSELPTAAALVATAIKGMQLATQNAGAEALRARFDSGSPQLPQKPFEPDSNLVVLMAFVHRMKRAADWVVASEGLESGAALLLQLRYWWRVGSEAGAGSAFESGAASGSVPGLGPPYTACAGGNGGAPTAVHPVQKLALLAAFAMPRLMSAVRAILETILRNKVKGKELLRVIVAAMGALGSLLSRVYLSCDGSASPEDAASWEALLLGSMDLPGLMDMVVRVTLSCGLVEILRDIAVPTLRVMVVFPARGRQLLTAPWIPEQEVGSESRSTDTLLSRLCTFVQPAVYIRTADIGDGSDPIRRLILFGRAVAEGKDIGVQGKKWLRDFDGIDGDTRDNSGLLLAALVPPPWVVAAEAARRQLPPLCANPGCANLEGDSELDFWQKMAAAPATSCRPAGSNAGATSSAASSLPYWYCCSACNQEHRRMQRKAIKSSKRRGR